MGLTLNIDRGCSWYTEGIFSRRIVNKRSLRWGGAIDKVCETSGLRYVL